MQIERPAFPPVAALAGPPPATIGEFLRSPRRGTGRPCAVLQHRRAGHRLWGSGAHRQPAGLRGMRSISSAPRARGCRGIPFSRTVPAPAASWRITMSSARYCVALGFEQKPDGSWGDSAQAIQMPRVIDFKKAEAPSAALDEFARTLTTLLAHFEDFWTKPAEPEPDWAATMGQLGAAGSRPHSKRCRARFRWLPDGMAPDSIVPVPAAATSVVTPAPAPVAIASPAGHGAQHAAEDGSARRGGRCRGSGGDGLHHGQDDGLVEFGQIRVGQVARRARQGAVEAEAAREHDRLRARSAARRGGRRSRCASAGRG